MGDDERFSPLVYRSLLHRRIVVQRSEARWGRRMPQMQRKWTLEPVGCAEHSEAHLSRTMRFVSLIGATRFAVLDSPCVVRR